VSRRIDVDPNEWLLGSVVVADGEERSCRLLVWNVESDGIPEDGAVGSYAPPPSMRSVLSESAPSSPPRLPQMREAHTETHRRDGSMPTSSLAHTSRHVLPPSVLR
jgi:hypothetical protein